MALTLRRRRLPFAWGLVAAAVLAASARAAAPRDELLRLVPDDVGLCLVVQDLRGHAAALNDSPFAARLRASPFVVALRQAPEVRKLAAVEQQLKEHLQIDAQQLRDEILGDAVVVAYRPGPPGKPEQEQGLLLLQARDADRLAALIDRLNEVQKQAGDLMELEERGHRGKKYYLRVEKKGKNYYYLRGPVLVFTPQEEALQRAIDLDREAPPAETVPALSRQLRRLGADQALATLYVNPRAFDADLENKAHAAKGSDAAFLQTFQVYWKALDGLALFAEPTRDLELSLSVRARPEALPPAARNYLAAAGQRSELWDRFPPAALFAMAGRFDAVALVDMLAEFLTPEARKAIRDAVDRGAGAALGKDVATEVLPYLGPDWGFCVTAPPADGKDWFPHAVWVTRVRSGKDGAPLGPALVTALNSFAMLAVFQHNSHNTEPLSLKATMQDQVEVKYLTGEKVLPPGLRPAFALKDGYLVLATSPEAIRAFAAKRTGTLVTEAGEVPLMRASLRALRAFLKERREPLLAHAAQKDHVAPDEAARRVDGLAEVLELFDRVELTQRSAADQVTLTLRVKPAQPLRR
jgi:hypothetical protein